MKRVSPCYVWSYFAILLLPQLLVASDSAFVARRAVTLSGAVDGTLQLAADGNVQITSGASVSGDVVLPAEKNGPTNEPAAKVRSPKTTFSSSADNVKGAVRAADAFSLPRVLPPTKPVKTATRLVQGKASVPTDFSEIGDLTLRQPAAVISVPPGAYGDFVVVQGTITLGVAGTTEPTRYEFRSLDVQSGGEMNLIGPVVVTVAKGGTWRGRAGNTDAPLWLDLRIAGGGMIFGAGADFYGLLSAPDGSITVRNGSKLTGGVIADEIIVEKGAKASGVQPDWSRGANSYTRPRFFHKALRLESTMPDLKRIGAKASTPASSYIEDIPFVMLTDGELSENSRAAQQRLFFETFRALFQQAQFEKAGVVLVRKTTGLVPSIRRIVLTRALFEALVNAVGAKAGADNAATISATPRLAAEFMQRCLAMNQTPGAAP